MKMAPWLRVSLPFLLFLVIGTAGLVVLLSAAYRHQSREEFAALARANADFIRETGVPPTERFAGYLSRVLGMEVHFREVKALDPGEEAVTVSLGAGGKLTLVREEPVFLRWPVVWGAVASFWGLSLALAWAVMRPYLEAQRLALLGQMATSLAHEVQNPVAAIRLQAELTGQEMIVTEAGTIESLVNQWMFLARPHPPRKSPVALEEVVDAALRGTATTARHARVRVVREGRGEVVEADSRRMRQVFQNLITNALQAMSAGGELRVTVEGRTVRLRDTGPGFSRHFLARGPRLFYSEREGGMGIGLAVSREIVRAHGGRLELANHLTGGAEVTVRL